MGLITRSYTFVDGQTPTGAEWNLDINQLFTLVNGQIDKANVDSASSDGIVTLDEAQTITGTKTFSDDLLYQGAGPHAVGGSTVGCYRAYLLGNYTSDGSFSFAAALAVGGTLTGANGDTGHQAGTNLFTNIVTQSNSETVGVVAQLYAEKPGITKGTDTVTNAATIYVLDSPTDGTNNYGLFVDEGLARFDGDGTDVFELPADATDPTSGGGAASGRIPVKIGGSTFYLAYY